MMKKLSTLALVPSLWLACAPEPEPEPEPPAGLGVLGFDSHSIDSVNVIDIGTADDGVNGPRDLDFNPEVEGELWVVNRVDDSVVIFMGLDTEDETGLHLVDPFAEHFMEEVSSLSFAADMKFGTCQESRNTYNGQAPPNDFMGPTLWSADLDVFARTNPDAVDFLGFDLGSHLDMLHESPLCMGIAWVEDNVYFTFDGLTGTVSRYDFVEDHGAGFDDHDDGIVERFIDAGVARVPDVPSHLAYDHETDTLYIADTGNGRILTLDATTGTPTTPLAPMEPGVTLYTMEGARFETLVDAEVGELEHPSGIAVQDGIVYVTDNATSRISAFDAETGERLDYLETELPAGSLMGLRVDDLGRIWAVDFLGDRVFRVEQHAP